MDSKSIEVEVVPRGQITTTNAPFAKTTQFLGVILAITGGLMAYADKLQEISAISPKLAQWWPIVLAGATFLDRVVKLVISFISHFQKAAPLILLAFLFAGCASTKVYDATTGKLKLATGADAVDLYYSDNQTVLHVTGLDHSTTNKTVADGIQKGIAAGGVAGALLIK